MKSRKINAAYVSEYSRNIEANGISTDEPWMRHPGRGGRRSVYLGAYESSLRSTGGAIPVPEIIFEPTRLDIILRALAENRPT